MHTWWAITIKMNQLHKFSVEFSIFFFSKEVVLQSYIFGKVVENSQNISKTINCHGHRWLNKYLLYVSEKVPMKSLASMCSSSYTKTIIQFYNYKVIFIFQLKSQVTKDIFDLMTSTALSVDKKYRDRSIGDHFMATR